MNRVRKAMPWVGMLLVTFMLVAHLLAWESVTIDTTTLVLLGAFIVVPFLDQVTRIKVGDVEAEIGSHEIAKAIHSAERELGPEQAEVLPPGKREPLILTLTREDPQLGLAKLRIEFEQALRALVRTTGVPPITRGRATPTRMAGALQLNGILSDEIAGAIDDIMPLANRAAHGEHVRQEDAEELAQLGLRVLEELRSLRDEKLTEIKEKQPIEPATLRDWMDAKYRVETVVPLVDSPYRSVREVTQEGLSALLEGYGEYAEFIVGVDRIS